MQDKKWIFGLIVVIALIGLSVWGFSQKEKNKPQVAGTNTSVSYFDDNAKVKFFYSEQCSWCVKEKEVLAKLAPEGYKVKPMDVAKNQNLWTDYSIKGTPTFIADNGDRFEGYHEYDSLKAWLDQHK